MQSTMGIIFLLLFLCVYFAPTLIASKNKKANIIPIFILNLFFGWTLIGWVGALIWAYLK